MNMRQLGRFQISRQLVDENPQAVVDTFNMLHCVVVRAEMLYHLDAIEYIGISPRFELVHWARIVPEYLVEITTSADGDVELVKVKQIKGEKNGSD